MQRLLPAIAMSWGSHVLSLWGDCMFRNAPQLKGVGGPLTHVEIAFPKRLALRVSPKDRECFRHFPPQCTPCCVFKAVSLPRDAAL